MTKKDPNFIRYFGYNERFEVGLYTLNLYCSNNVTCRYAIPDSVSSEDDELEPFFDRIVAQTVLQHPVLQVGLARESARKPYWVQLPTLNLENHVTWIDATASEDYDALCSRVSQEQRGTRFPNLDKQPGWRLVFIKHGSRRSIDVVFSYIHAHADGMSGRIFHETLLRNLNATESPDELLMLDGRCFNTNTQTNKLLPQQEKLANFTKGVKWTTEAIWKELRPLQFGPAVTDAAWAPIRAPLTSTQFCTLAIPNNVLGPAVAACRKHNTTLTGLINALALVSLSRRLSEKDAQGFRGCTPISTRPFVKPSSKNHNPPYDPDQTMGNLVTIVNHDFGADVVASVRKPQGVVGSIPIESLMDVIWSVSAGVRGEIKQLLDSGLKNNPLSLMSFVPDWRKYHEEELKKPRTTAWVVTNIGVLDGEPVPPGGSSGSKWKIDRALFQLSAEATRAFFHICLVAVKGRDLNIDVSWQDGILDVGLGGSLLQDMGTMMRYIAAKQAEPQE